MFEALSDRFDGIFKRLRGKGKLAEADVDEVLREIRVALLEADVNFRSSRDLVEPHPRAGRRRRAVSEALNPAQQVIKIVHEELIATLGGETIQITYARKPPTVVLMAGLQGSGKTTNSAKLARWFKQQGRNPLLVGADLQRPAAVEQLRTLGAQIDVPVFSEPGDPVARRPAGLDEARRLGRDVLIVDTAGRLAIDAELMDQVRRHLRAVTARLHVPRRRRHDRPGRRHRRRGLPRRPSRSTASSSPSSTATPAAAPRSRVKEVVGQAHRLRLHRREARATSTSSTPTAWPAASSAWATCSPSSRRPSRSTRRRRPRRPRPGCSRASSPSTTSSTRCSSSRRWARSSGLVGMIPGMPKELKNAEIDDDADRPGRGDHPLDDPGRAGRPRPHRRLAPRAASPRAAAPDPARSASSSSSSRRCRR